MINIPSYKNDPSYRYQMPALKIKVEGSGNGFRTKLLNLFEVSRCLGVPPEYPLRFFGAEYGALIEFKQNEQKAMLNGNRRVEDLQRSLDLFIEKFVLCPKCTYPEINIRIKKAELYSDCKACGEVRKMDMIHKIVNYILKFPPPGSTKTPTGKKRGAAPRVRSSGKKKSKSFNLKGPEIQECLDRLAEETDLTRTSEILTNLSASKNFETDIRAYLMFKGVFGNNLISLMSNPASIILLKQYANGCAEDFLMAFATVYGLEEPWKDKTSTVLFHFFNNDLISEEFFLGFANDDLDFNESSPVYNEQALEEVRKNAFEFIDWLKNAEEEEKDESAGENQEEVEEAPELQEINGDLENKEYKNEENQVENRIVKENNEILDAKSKPEDKKPIEPEKPHDLMSKLKQMEDFNIDDI